MFYKRDEKNFDSCSLIVEWEEHIKINCRLKSTPPFFLLSTFFYFLLSSSKWVAKDSLLEMSLGK